MFEVLHVQAEERTKLFQHVANTKKVTGTIIEKDFWVCFMLEILFNQSEYQDYFAFKGGTSLSKSYNLIHRFSEDIDLILDWRKLGYCSTEIMKEKSNTQQAKLNKDIQKKTIEFIENEFIPKMKEAIQDFLLPEDSFDFKIDPMDKQTVLMTYPREFEDEASYIVQDIRLEIGALAAWTPVQIEEVSAYIYSVSDVPLTKHSTNVPTLSASRTFWEKITILHAEAHRPEEKSLPARYSRHYYDVFMIQKNEEMLTKSLDNIYLLQEVVEFKKRFYPTSWASYDKALNKDLILIPANSCTINELKIDYEKMKEMLFEEIPTFEEIVEALRSLQKKINEIS